MLSQSSSEHSENKGSNVTSMKIRSRDKPIDSKLWYYLIIIFIFVERGCGDCRMVRIEVINK